MLTKRTRVGMGLALAAALLMRADRASATLTYNSADSTGGTTISFSPGILTSGDTDSMVSSGQKAATITPGTTTTSASASLTYTLTTTYPNTPTYQFSAKDTVKKSGAAAGSSFATASAEAIANPTTAAIKVQAGTGVTQSSTPSSTHAYTTASDLQINFDEFFTVGSTGSGPGVTGVASFVLGGSIASGGSAAFSGQFSFFDDSETSGILPATVGGEGVEIGSINLGTTTFNNPGPNAETFSRTFSASTLFNDPGAESGSGFLPAGALIEVKGSIDFKATDDDTTGITLTTPGGVGATTGTVLDLTSASVPAPEPATMMLAAMGAGAAGLGALRRRKLQR